MIVKCYYNDNESVHDTRKVFLQQFKTVKAYISGFIMAYFLNYKLQLSKFHNEYGLFKTE